MHFVHALVLFVESFAADRERQRHVRWWINDGDELIASPRTYLAEHQVKIGVDGATNQRLLSVIGLACFLIGMALCGTLGWLEQQGAKFWAAVGGLVGGGLVFVGAISVLAALLLLFKMRRQIALKPGGVEFCYGRSMVFAPWGLFAPDRPQVEQKGKSVRMRINPRFTDEVTLYRGTSPVAVGQAASKWFFRVVSESEIELPRAFWAEPAEVAAVFYAVGAQIEL